MFRSWRIGRVFGVPTELHWTFVLVPVAILFYAFTPGVGIRWAAVRWWSAIGLMLCFFVLTHELGHALTARWRGVEVKKIILFPLGGGALIPKQPERTLDAVMIYAAGPGANVLLALLALPVLLSQPSGYFLLRSYVDRASNFIVVPSLTEQLLGVTVAVNVVLAVGNLLPAYPLDGGRILRALLRSWAGERRATVVATVLGVIIGGVLVGLSIYLGDPLLGLSALFVISFSVAELNRGWQRRHLDRADLSEVLRPLPSPERRLFARTPVQRALDIFSHTEETILPVYNPWNEPEGFVSHDLLRREALPSDTLLPHYEPEFITAAMTDNLLEVTERIVAADVYGAIVYDTSGRPVGFVVTEDVIGLLDRSPRRFYRRWGG